MDWLDSSIQKLSIMCILCIQFPFCNLTASDSCTLTPTMLKPNLKPKQKLGLILAQVSHSQFLMLPQEQEGQG